MMKPLYFLAILLGTSALTAAAQDTTYFDLFWHPSDIQHARYFRTSTKTSAGRQVVDHWLDGKVQMTGGYADDSMKVQVGEFVFYDTAGAVEHRCVFVDGKENGPETFYYPNGQIRMTGSMKDGKFDRGWTGFYSSGKLAGKANYKAGEQTRGVFYNEDGSPNGMVTKFYTESEYPGGIPRWTYFLNKHLFYPDSAIKYNIEGTVIITFKVSKDGEASDFTVDQSVDPYLDAEALRVMKLSVKWEPAVYGGVFCDSYKRQPIVFKLE